MHGAQAAKVPPGEIPKRLFGNKSTLAGIHLKDCFYNALSLPIHCLALGCTIVGQIEDDVSNRAAVYAHVARTS